MKRTPLAHLQANFFTGFAVVFPAVISIAVVVWLFGTVSNITDKLLFTVPREWKYVNGVSGEIHWYWSLAALALAIAMVTLLGSIARHYIGRKLIELGENILLRVPLLNKIYSTIKQVKEAFAGKESSFQQAVLVEFPRTGMYSIGFVTAEQRDEVQTKTAAVVCSVFVPTTPNPTTGFLIFVPETELVRLDMSVPDAIKSIISLGTVSPEFLPRVLKPATGISLAERLPAPQAGPGV